MSESLIGRTKVVIVSHCGGRAQAVISSVIASLRADGAAERLHFTGPVAVEARICLHIRDTILPIVDSVMEGLGRPLRNYDLSLTNLGFASVAEVPLLVRGYSADLPVFLSLFSASTGIPISEEFLCTGHIAAGGDIRAVAGIPGKLDAATCDSSVTCFICPDLEADRSLGVLAPHEKERIVDAVIRGKRKIRIQTVRDIAELVEAVLDNETVVLAAFREGFYETRVPPESTSSGAGRIVQFLVRDNEKRFWTALEPHLMKGQADLAKRLLLALVLYCTQARSYPQNLGLNLLQRVAALPPHIRRRKGFFPLIPVKRCIELGQFARESDWADVETLLEAVRGGRCRAPGRGIHSPSGGSSPVNRPQGALDEVLSQISARAMNDSVGRVADTARLSFLLQDVTVDSDQEFHDTIRSFFLHLARHSGRVTQADPEAAADDAYALLTRAFSRHGGPQAALSEAREGVHGGMRYILDLMTDQYKREETEKRVTRVLKECLDQKNWEEKVAFMKAFLDRLGPDLFPEIKARNPEQCAHHYEVLVRAYVDSMEQVKNLLRCL